MNSHNLTQSLPAGYLDKPVPARYRGVWRRTLLEAPGLRDTETTVFWIQTNNWHADLRIPHHKPNFARINSVHDCSAEQLAWLAGQHGFSGVTVVDAAADPEVCTWHRILDFQPPSYSADAGYMHFNGKKLIETGVHAEYLEEWKKLPGSDNGFAVLERIDVSGKAATPSELLMVAGDFVMHVKNRQSDWPAGIHAGEDLVRSTVADKSLLEMEVSFGRRTASGWKIRHSSLPWLESKAHSLAIVEHRNELLEMDLDGERTHWHVLEWTHPR